MHLSSATSASSNEINVAPGSGELSLSGVEILVLGYGCGYCSCWGLAVVVWLHGKRNSAEISSCEIEKTMTLRVREFLQLKTRNWSSRRYLPYQILRKSSNKPESDRIIRSYISSVQSILAFFEIPSPSDEPLRKKSSLSRYANLCGTRPSSGHAHNLTFLLPSRKEKTAHTHDLFQCRLPSNSKRLLQPRLRFQSIPPTA